MLGGVRLIVGLGNPENEYKKTRHNAGFWAVNAFAATYSSTFSLVNKFFGELAVVSTNSTRFNNVKKDILLLKPQTYMNLSGKAVLAVANFYKIMPEEILIIHDELDFAVGIMRLKQGGGNGGHNGLKDIDRVMGKNYWRLRIGIGHPLDKNTVVSYVLKAPSVEDKITIDNAITQILNDNILESLIKGDFNNAMKQLHTDK